MLGRLAAHQVTRFNSIWQQQCVFLSSAVQTQSQALDAAAEALRTAKCVAVTAGAGIGVDSGLPDFRNEDGFWRAYPPLKSLGYSFEDMATPDTFRDDPQLAWGFYGHRLELYRKTVPHAGFQHLKQLLSRGQEPGFVVTSNVDGQFQKAGFDESRLLEVHGTIHQFQCELPMHCPAMCSTWAAPPGDLKYDTNLRVAKEDLPKCPCSMKQGARPNILMFRDPFWVDNRTADKFEQWMSSLSRRQVPVVVLDVGSGTSVPTIRRAAESIVIMTKGTLIRINPRESQIPSSVPGVSISMNCKAAIHAIMDRLA